MARAFAQAQSVWAGCACEFLPGNTRQRLSTFLLRRSSGSSGSAGGEVAGAISDAANCRYLLASFPCAHARGGRRRRGYDKSGERRRPLGGIGLSQAGDLDARAPRGLRVPVLVGVGQAFDIYAGRVRQAPRWMREHGLEWLFRLAAEPSRLWRRYLVYNSEFVFSELAEILGVRKFE
jgi:hypothetical protein